ncbi:MAG: hypothetical protein AAF699_05830 [Pseudomonadota bacterium]
MQTSELNSPNRLSERLLHMADTQWRGEGREHLPGAERSETSTYEVTLSIGSCVRMSVEGEAGSERICMQYSSQTRCLASQELTRQETGYWIFDLASNVFCKSISMPCSRVILAGGAFTYSPENGLVMVASAKAGDNKYGICSEPTQDAAIPILSFTSNMMQSLTTFNFSEMIVKRHHGREICVTNEATLQMRSAI